MTTEYMRKTISLLESIEDLPDFDAIDQQKKHREFVRQFKRQLREIGSLPTWFKKSYLEQGRDPIEIYVNEARMFLTYKDIDPQPDPSIKEIELEIKWVQHHDGVGEFRAQFYFHIDDTNEYRDTQTWFNDLKLSVPMRRQLNQNLNTVLHHYDFIPPSDLKFLSWLSEDEDLGLVLTFNQIYGAPDQILRYLSSQIKPFLPVIYSAGRYDPNILYEIL